MLLLGTLALICIMKPYSGVDVNILVPMVYRGGDFLVFLSRHTVQMVGLLYWSIRCKGHVNFNLFYSAIRCKWSDYDIGSYIVQGMLIFLFRHTV